MDIHLYCFCDNVICCIIYYFFFSCIHVHVRILIELTQFLSATY